MSAPRPPSAADYVAAYRSGAATPSDVVAATLSAIRRSDFETPPLRAILRVLEDEALVAAEASTRRWRQGAPLSLLDGVPVALKDNIDLAGVPTTNGTRIEFPLPERDAICARRLRDAGAILVGKANLHEIGAGTTGINPSQGTARNPWDTGRWCGGSSSGSACAVGAELVPIALGTDAGGSIRAPAAFVGAVGLKPTFGRVSRRGMSIVCDTLDHVGPIAATVADAALCYALLAGVEQGDDETWDQPPVASAADCLRAIDDPISGVRVGVARAVFDHPRVEPEIAARVAVAARTLEEAGAVLSEVTVPSLEDCFDVGLLLLAAEGPSGMEEHLFANEELLGADLQVLLRVGEQVSARDYMHAQRARKGIARAWREIFSDVDLVLLPATGMTAGPIHEDALLTGELDEVSSAKAISCTFPSNLTGFPAVSVPCGLVAGMPVGAQLVAAPWQEMAALRGARVIERAGLMPPVRPRRRYGDEILARPR